MALTVHSKRKNSWKNYIFWHHLILKLPQWNAIFNSWKIKYLMTVLNTKYWNLEKLLFFMYWEVRMKLFGHSFIIYDRNTRCSNVVKTLILRDNQIKKWNSAQIIIPWSLAKPPNFSGNLFAMIFRFVIFNFFSKKIEFQRKVRRVRYENRSFRIIKPWLEKIFGSKLFFRF